MTTTIGRVDFTARIDGRRTPRDAENVGRKAGAAGAEGFDETWSKGYEDSLTDAGKKALARWRQNGKKDGGVYGSEISKTMKKFLTEARADVANLRLRPGFLDDFTKKFGDAGLAARDLQVKLIELHREGEITGQVFEASKRQVDGWARAQRQSADSTNKQLDSMGRLSAFLDEQRRAYEANQRTLEENTRTLEENEKAFNLERRRQHLAHLSAVRQRLLENVELHIRSTSALRGHIRQVGDAGLAYRTFSAHLDQYRIAAGGIDRTYIDISRNIDRVTESMNKSAKSADGMNFSWSQIPHNGRQVILISAAIAGGMQQIATLGSAAGAGLLVLGGAAGGALVGVGGLVAAFKVLGGDAEKVPESIKAAAEAFRGLKEPLREAQEFLAERAFAGTERAFGRIGDAIRELTPALAPLGDVINELTNQFADWVSSADGIRLISGLLEGSAPIFKRVMDIVGKLGIALLEAFDNPKFQKAVDDMLAGVEGLMDTFGAFVKSDEFGVWIEETSSVLGSLGGLLGGISTLIDDLVTPEAYERTRNFIDNLTASLPGLGEFLDIFSELDIFGVIAVGLNELLNGLKPLWDLLSPIASIVGDLLVGSFQNLHFWILLLTPALEVLRILFEILASALSKWLEYVTPFQEGFQLLSDAFARAGDIIWEHLKPAFDILWDAIIDLLPTAEEFTTWLNDYAIPAIEDFAKWLGEDGADAIKDFAGWLQDEAVPAMKKFWEWLSEKVWPVVSRASEVLGKAVGAFMVFTGGVSNALSILTAPIRFAIDLFRQLASAASIALGNASAAKSAGANFPKFASGGILGGPRYILAGEEGPEAVVPLNRPLSRVDPSVRWLSAIAQGRSPAMAAGGITGSGGGRTNNVEAGAIVIQEARDPLATSVEVLDRLVEQLN